MGIFMGRWGIWRGGRGEGGVLARLDRQGDDDYVESETLSPRFENKRGLDPRPRKYAAHSARHARHRRSRPSERGGGRLADERVRQSRRLGEVDEHLRIDDVVVDVLGRAVPVLAAVAPGTVVALEPTVPMFLLRGVGPDSNKSGGVVMIRIRCETGDDVIVEGDSLVGAGLRRAALHRALLDNQVLDEADLSEAELRSAWLEGATFRRARLVGASLAAANASRASFVEADLSQAMMRAGVFERADFCDAKLHGARVEGANFAGANLSGADLRCEGLHRANLRGAHADIKTLWPDDFLPEMFGVQVAK